MNTKNKLHAAFEWDDAIAAAKQREMVEELSNTELKALDAFDIDALWRKIQASLPPCERKTWKVIDMWGHTILRFKTKDEAMWSATARNQRAERLGVHMRYRVVNDDGFDS